MGHSLVYDAEFVSSSVRLSMELGKFEYLYSIIPIVLNGLRPPLLIAIVIPAAGSHTFFYSLIFVFTSSRSRNYLCGPRNIERDTLPGC